MKKLILLGKPNCGGCDSTKNKFADENVQYTYIDGYANPDEAVKYGIMSFPVIVLEENEEEIARVYGFNPPELDKLIAQL